MKTLIQSVKDEALAKWSFRALGIEEMKSWWNKTGNCIFSFCVYYNYKDDCKCILHDNGQKCCYEMNTVKLAVDTENLALFNYACQLMYNRIAALPVEDEIKKINELQCKSGFKTGDIVKSKTSDKLFLIYDIYFNVEKCAILLILCDVTGNTYFAYHTHCVLATSEEQTKFMSGSELIPLKSITIKETDYKNLNYHDNVLEIDYGVCKRYLRLDQRRHEFWILTEKPDENIKG